MASLTPPDLTRELQAITAALDDRLTIIREVIDMNHKVVATYRRTVRLPRHDERKTP
ncbi:MAG: hypothetical protein ABL986_04695 [Vicinamibacterales bacterium]